MRWQRLLFLLFLVPTLVFGLDQATCTKIHDQVGTEWKRHYELIVEHNSLNVNEIDKRLQLLKESVECCRRAIVHCDTVLNDIAGKSKDKRKKPWRVEMKRVCEEDKNHLNTEIKAIEPGIQQLEGQLALQKAGVVYQRSLEKASQANSKEGDCQRRLDNVDEVVAVLNEVSWLYAEAASLAREALALVAPHSFLSQDQKNLQKVIENYRELFEKYKKEAADWPVVIVTQTTILKEKLATLKEDSKLFAEKELKRNCYELQKQSFPILEQLIENGSDEETEIFKRELEELKAAISAFEQDADSNRLTDISPLLSTAEFKSRENDRREHFFKQDASLSSELALPRSIEGELRPFAFPLDGYVMEKEKDFTLYSEQFYRFLVQSDFVPAQLLVKVYEHEEIIYEEKILLPLKEDVAWEHYLTSDGMTFNPETGLKKDFGFDLRLHFVCDPVCPFSMIISQKGGSPIISSRSL